MLYRFPWKTCPEITALISAVRPPLFACKTAINAAVRPPWNVCSYIKCCCMEICLDFCASNHLQAVRPAWKSVQQKQQPLPRNLCPENGTASLEIVLKSVVWILPWKPCQIFLELSANFAIRTCWKTALEYVLSCCLLLLTAQKSPLLSFSQSAHERMNDLFLLFLL